MPAALSKTMCRRWARLAAIMLTAVTLAACHSLLRPYPPPKRAGLDYITYYVSSSGHNSASGTSPAQAWRSLARVQSVVLHPGTRLLLQGGKRFTGELALSGRDGGDAGHPVTIGSYGGGRATIVSHNGTAISLFDAAGVVIRDLAIRGMTVGHRYSAGISAYSDLPAGRKLRGLVIENVAVSSFVDGISIGGVHPGAGYMDVTVRNSVLSGNLDEGLITYGAPFRAAHPQYENADVTISHVVASGSSGDPSLTAHNSGSGLVLGAVENGTISWSTAYDNGGREGSREGPEGIWAYDSRRITIEHCLSYHNKTRDKTDGNGFGLDENTSESTIEYNLSYGNDGSGYLVLGRKNDGAETGDVIRFNVSSGDVLDNNPAYGGISVIGFTRATAVYQNTVVMTSGGTAPPSALLLGPPVRGISVYNNIFRTQRGHVITAQRWMRPQRAQLQGNDYFAASGPWSVLWGPTSYPSIAAWRIASGEEMFAHQPVGSMLNPRLRGPLYSLLIAVPGVLNVAPRFTLREGSPLIGGGLDLARNFGIDPGKVNYSGARISWDRPNVGAE